MIIDRAGTDRPGTDRPLSMQLRCRCVVPARVAGSSRLTRRRVRHPRNAPARPPPAGSVITPPVYTARPPLRDWHPATGGAAGVGLEVLVLGPDGRIVSDYQFIEG